LWVLVPGAVALGYLGLLIDRLGLLVSWENANSDVASAYVLADAVAHGHTGTVVMSNQAAWAPLWYGVATHGLPFHRVLWEISPALLALAAALLIGWTVARVGDAARGALAVLIIVAASPSALIIFTAAAYHNTTVPGVALLGGFLVWAISRRPAAWALATAVGLLSLLVGVFVASDPLLAAQGLIPLAAAVLLLRKRLDGRVVGASLALLVGSVTVAVITSQVMQGLNFTANTPGLGFTSRFIPTHIKWLVQGLLRLGNGLSVAPHGPARTPLVLASGVVVVAALGAVAASGLLAALRTGLVPARRVARLAGRRSADRDEPGRDVHVVFWVGSLLVAAVAYVITTVASRADTERYFLVAVPAVAAIVPLLPQKKISWLATSVGATVFAAASIVSLAANDAGRAVFQGPDIPQARAIEAVVRTQNLTVGYAGYWDAASLDWVTRQRLTVYPLTDKFGPLEPMYQNRVNAWYRPRPNTASYLILAPDDNNLADRLPPGLPAPRRQFKLGAVTLAVFPVDIARYLHPPHRP